MKTYNKKILFYHETNYKTYYRFATGLLKVFYRLSTDFLTNKLGLNFSRGGFENFDFIDNFQIDNVFLVLQKEYETINYYFR